MSKHLESAIKKVSQAEGERIVGEETTALRFVVAALNDLCGAVQALERRMNQVEGDLDDLETKL